LTAESDCCKIGAADAWARADFSTCRARCQEGKSLQICNVKPVVFLGVAGYK
jgi:hypothetical protein